MDMLLIKSRYKVTQTLHVEENYAAFLAVDIGNREKGEYLLNVYEGALAKRYANCFERLRHCPEYVEMFLADGALVAVFTFKQKNNIDSLFYQGAEIDWRIRVHYAQQLFHLALSVSDFPPEIGCAALLSANLCVLPQEQGLSVNYMVQPLAGANSRELVYLLADQIQKIFIKRFDSANAELKFLETLNSGRFKSVTPLYSHWLEVKQKIIAEQEEISGMGALHRSLRLIWLNIKRWFKHIFGGKR